MSEELLEAVEAWFQALLNKTKSLAADAKLEVEALVRQEYQDPTKRQKTFDHIAKMLVERIDNEQSSESKS